MLYNSLRGCSPKAGFTLIELLIVVAIIAILAAIAVPNFLEAQVRSKVSRVHNDLRNLATGMEAYCVEWNDYPEASDEGIFVANYPGRSGLLRLTTPVAYLSSVPFDPFLRETNDVTRAGKLTYELASSGLTGLQPKGWAAYSCGPDLADNTGPGVPIYPAEIMETTLYDPSNGTRSRGDILRFGPGIYPDRVRFR
jgi:type II secretion system protein G